MAQAQLKIETTPQRDVFNGAIETLVARHATLAFANTDMKAIKKEVAEASRVAGWAAFDLMQADGNNDWSATGQDLALEIAEARGIEGDSLKVYAQRGRDMAKFHVKLAGSDRTKADPLTLVKKLRETATTKQTQRAADAIYMSEAREIAMGVLEMTPSAFDAELISLDGQEAREALDNALDLCRKRGEVLNTVRDIVATLNGADADTVAKAKELFAILA